MKSEAIAEAIGNVADRHVLEGVYGKSRRVPVKIIAAVAACLVCVLGMAYALRDTGNVAIVTEYYKIPTIAEVNKTAVSRTGSITPIPPDSSEIKMTKGEVQAFFGRSREPFKAKEAEYTATLNGGGSVRMVSMTWYFESGSVTAIFEPNAYPKAIFNSEYSVKTEAADCRIATILTKIDSSEGEYDIGIEKGNMGAWVICNEGCKAEAQALVNYIIDSNILFESESVTFVCRNG